MTDLAAIIRDASSPLEPIPTGVEEKIDPLPGIEVVLFDVYGTLFISASGDIGASEEEEQADAVHEAMEAVGIPDDFATGFHYDDLHRIIRQHHARLRADDAITWPEVDITDVWSDLVREGLKVRGIDPNSDSAPEWLREINLERLAIEYETRTNPVWPMPNLSSTLSELAGQYQLGIVSNAQFFTPLMFDALLGKSVKEIGFDPALGFWSYLHRRAKPGKYLYERVAERLSRMDIRPDQALYIGNDMRNDIAPAADVGFRTVLFAGDKRSLRLRRQDERMRNVFPDRVVTDLSRIPEMISS